MKEQESKTVAAASGDVGGPVTNDLEIAKTESAEQKPASSSELLAGGLEQGKALLNEHKGKLAIGAAATLGLMVYYKWRDKKLAEEDPEEYARLQRIKAAVQSDSLNANEEEAANK